MFHKIVAGDLWYWNAVIDGQAALEGPIEEVARLEAQEAEDLLKHLGIPVLKRPK